MGQNKMTKIKDVIINAFSCSQQAPCNKWVSEFFTDAPLTINVPSVAFRQKAIEWAKTGDLFKAAVKENFKEDIEIRRRGMTTFSLGWSFADELLKFPNEIDKLDAYLLLDGCHTKQLNNWFCFAKRAAEGKAFFVMAHSSIVPPYISSTESNSKIFDSIDGAAISPCIEVPDYILKATLPPDGIAISLAKSNGTPAVSKHWAQDPLIGFESAGNMTKLHYGGNDRPDHVYIAWYVSKRLWQWFGTMWSISECITDMEKETESSSEETVK